jgi:hypothetical protein
MGSNGCLGFFISFSEVIVVMFDKFFCFIKAKYRQIVCVKFLFRFVNYLRAALEDWTAHKYALAQLEISKILA